MVHAGRICQVEGCHGPVVAKGLCQTHYKRYSRHGSVKQTRREDWGERNNHPLYSTWKGVIRSYSNRVCPEWRDFWGFVEKVDSKPQGDVRFQIVDTAASMIGPSGYYWQTLELSEDTKGRRAKNVEYQRVYRAMNPDKTKDRDLRRKYGITLADWQKMYDEQGGVCKICGTPETKVDRRQGVVRSLSVDHCHGTGKVRGLLCSDCNTAIGLFKHSEGLLNKAIKYCKST